MRITEDPAYLRHRGKPLVVVWGVGFDKDRDYTVVWGCGSASKTVDARGLELATCSGPAWPPKPR